MEYCIYPGVTPIVCKMLPPESTLPLLISDVRDVTKKVNNLIS